jgi:hypothetical protein
MNQSSSAILLLQECISLWSLMNSSTWWNLCLPLVKPKDCSRYGNECDDFRMFWQSISKLSYAPSTQNHETMTSVEESWKRRHGFLTASIIQNTLSNKASIRKYNESHLKESLPFLHNNVCYNCGLLLMCHANQHSSWQCTHPLQKHRRSNKITFLECAWCFLMIRNLEAINNTNYAFNVDLICTNLA